MEIVGPINAPSIIRACPWNWEIKKDLYDCTGPSNQPPAVRMRIISALRRLLGDGFRDPNLTLEQARYLVTINLPGHALPCFLWDRAWPASERWQIWDLAPKRNIFQWKWYPSTFLSTIDDLDKPEFGSVDEYRLRRFAEFYDLDFSGGFGPG
jgi:hypothetical protein